MARDSARQHASLNARRSTAANSASLSPPWPAMSGRHASSARGWRRRLWLCRHAWDARGCGSVSVLSADHRAMDHGQPRWRKAACRASTTMHGACVNWQLKHRTPPIEALASAGWIRMPGVRGQEVAPCDGLTQFSGESVAESRSRLHLSGWGEQPGTREPDQDHIGRRWPPNAHDLTACEPTDGSSNPAPIPLHPAQLSQQSMRWTEALSQFVSDSRAKLGAVQSR